MQNFEKFNKKHTYLDKRKKYKNSPKNKVVDKRYIVSSQTAYHITQLALSEGLTEGRIIDKLMRTYRASMSISIPYQPE